MKPPPFDYTDPRSVPEALQLLTRHGAEGKILAGGQSLVPLLNMRLAQPQVLIDLNHIQELQFLERRDRDGSAGVSIGAMTRQRDIEDAGDVLSDFPLLREGIGYVGHPQIRNRGTIGGSIAHADPSAELPIIFLALHGVANVRSQRGERSIRAADFFLYTFTSALEPDELLTEVWLPVPPARTGQAFLEAARRHGDFALVAVAVSITSDEDGMCHDIRIVVGGAAPVPIRASVAEDTVRGQWPSLALFHRAGTTAMPEMEPTSDVHADAEYRREVAGTLITRALATAWERVPKGTA